MERAEDGDGVSVEVVFCPTAGSADLVQLRLPRHCTLEDALQASGLLQRHSLQLAGLNAGVWGRAQPADHLLRDGDRVEIYRPLLVDPKEARRQRYQAQRLKPGAR